MISSSPFLYPYNLLTIFLLAKKVPILVLCQSSRYFDALIRFHQTNLSTDYKDETEHNRVNSSPINVIELIETNLDVFKTILMRLSSLMNQTRINKINNQLAETNPNQNYHHQNRSNHSHLNHHHPYHQRNYRNRNQHSLCREDRESNQSLDFLFDCVVVSSRYLFDCLERLFSDELVDKLRMESNDFAVNDAIPEKRKFLTKKIKHQDGCIDTVNQETATTAIESESKPKQNWLSILEIYRLAKIYNLEYLSCELNELIREKRTLFWRRIRNAYYFW